MKHSLDQKKIIFILFVTAVVFLFVNIAADKLIGDDGSVEKVEADGSIISQKFISSLRNLGIDTTWIVQKNKTGKYPHFSVLLPPDLPIALAVKEVTNSLNEYNVSLNVVEKNISGRTFLNVSSNNRIKLYAEFNYAASLRRKAGSLGFIIENFDDLNEQEDSLLLYSPEAMAVVLSPSRSSVELAKRINKAGKEYVVELNDDISELTYKLSSSYSQPRLKSSLRSILADFDRAIFVMIDDNSGIYNSSVYTLLKSELQKRNIGLLERKTFAQLDEEMLRAYLHNINDGEKKAGIIDAEEYMKIGNIVAGFRKIGYKFINPSLTVHDEEKEN